MVGREEGEDATHEVLESVREEEGDGGPDSSSSEDDESCRNENMSAQELQGRREREDSLYRRAELETKAVTRKEMAETTAQAAMW